jgi:ATP-dependent Lon protease
MSDGDRMPMFPLSVVLLPGAALPLHIFEDRYRALMSDLLAGDDAMRFGIPPILRGREVGGGDERCETAAVVHAVDPRVAPDGRFTLVAASVGRVEITEWLPDDPYPQALVRPLVDNAEWSGAVALDQLAQRAHEIARLAAVELPGALHLVEDPAAVSFALGALLPIADLDRLALLRSRDPMERCRLLMSAFDDVEAVLKFRDT